jgi:8-oxo-dGTP diphosphatase
MLLLPVVAAALIRDGRVLAARRSRPAQLAGGWEFPGGKVEAGEAEPAALTRELDEELGVAVQVGPRLGEATDGRIRLVLYAARTVHGEPAAGADHDAVRWLAADELDALAWLPIDRDLLPVVGALLERGGQD